MNPFQYLAYVIILFLLLIASLILKSIPSGERKNKLKDFILMGLILAILNVLIINFLMTPFLTPKSEIEIFCESGYFFLDANKLTQIEIHNDGLGNAKNVIIAIEHPFNELPFKFRSPDHELFCRIENYLGDEEEYFGKCLNKQCRAYTEHRTWVVCDFIPAGYVLELYTNDWVQNLTLHSWGENLFYNKEEIICKNN